MATPRPHEFAGVIVDSVRVKKGHGGVTRTFDEPMVGRDFRPGIVEDMLEKYVFGKLGESYPYEVEYNLTIRASNPWGAKTKARLFARAKHPFSTSRTVVEMKGRDTDLERFSEGPRKYYTVKAKVSG